jgi:hypothetical protein
VRDELTVVQMSLPAGLLPRPGEAALVVGPDGTLVLVDVGNSNHAQWVRAAVLELNTTVLTPANGFAARAPLQVEWVVLTHFHADHIGAFEALFTKTTEPLTVKRGIVHRGLVDLGAGLTESDYKALCTGLRGAQRSLDMPLCRAATAAPCDPSSWNGAYPATGCPALFVGSLGEPTDDGEGLPTYLDLGRGARLTLIAADAMVSDGKRVAPSPVPFGNSTGDHENARSLVAVLAYGAFRYHLGGDLTGAGTADTPDIETHLVRTAGPRFYAPLGVDVVHAHHHARRTSSNATLASALAPRDGRSRNVVAGINAAYLGSPHPEVLAAWLDGGRLGAGFFWVTARAGSASHPRLLDAAGPVIIQTLAGGRGYRMQAPDALMFSRAFASLRDVP